MCPQFGYWSSDGRPLDPGHREYLCAKWNCLSPAAGGSRCGSDFEIFCAAPCAEGEPASSRQPYLTSSGHILTWDGRLDNAPALCEALAGGDHFAFADVEMVGKAYERWGIACLPKLLGDWALSIWNPEDRMLFLAKDFMGLRPLYYRRQGRQVLWSSSIDALLFEEDRVSLSEEYATALLFSFPATQLTPYREIDSVPPATVVTINTRATASRTYWTLDSSSRVRYRDDSQYEEHFRDVFFRAVRRRLRSPRPICAELSGGMDSSSIVCVADAIAAENLGRVPRLDTLSYIDNSEPDWNELPYISLLEKKRGRSGLHIDISQATNLLPRYGDDFPVTPAALVDLPEASVDFADYRVLLSGIGGDEALGGVVTPLPELADLLMSLHFGDFARQSLVWALRLKKPLFPLMAHAATTALPFGRSDDGSLSPEWMTPHSVAKHSELRRAQSRSLHRAKFPPGFRSNLDAIESLRRQIAHDVSASPVPRMERRYPYLDRDLWEFVCAIPREQILRPGQRRSLMRRSLAGIVPHEVLHRSRKAYVIRGPLNGIAVHWNEVTELLFEMRSVELGMVDAKLFHQALERARTGQPAAMVSIHRTIIVERWLRRVLDGSTPRRVVISPWMRIPLNSGIPRTATSLEARMS